jgi:hypothetical protein
MAITNGYCARDDVKNALRIPLADTQDDDLIDVAVESASREIDGYTERVFYSATETRVYVPESPFVVQTDDIETLTTLKTAPDGEEFSVTWAESARQLEPLNGIAGGLTTPFTRIRAIGDYLFPIWDPNNVNAHEATVQVTGTFGFSTTPTAVKQACILLSMRLFKRFDAPLGAVGFGDIGVVRVSRIDPDIESLLSPWRKVRMA